MVAADFNAAHKGITRNELKMKCKNKYNGHIAKDTIPRLIQSHKTKDSRIAKDTVPRRRHF